jgi:hypothetical protein
VALLIGSGVLTAACVGERPVLTAESESTDTTLAATTTTASVPPAKVAQAKSESINLFGTATDTEPSGQLDVDEATAAPDIPMVFLVKGEEGERLEVYLPTPPVGGTGWVDRADVDLSSVSFRVEVSLQRHRLSVFDGAELVLDEAASIGADDRPEVGVTYYLKELLQPPDADGPYGAYSYGLSGYTTDLTGFDEGSGLVGIHGTDDEESLGEDTDTGSIGVGNDVIVRLVDELGLPLGTPVTIVA